VGRHETQELLLSLLLLGDLVSLRICRLLGPDAMETLEGPGLSDGLESLEVLHLIRNLHGADPLHDGLDRHDLAGELGGLGDLLGGGLALLGLLAVQWEQDQLALVLLQPLGVRLQRLNRLVPKG